MTRSARTRAVAGVAAGCVAGAVTARRAVRRDAPPPAATVPIASPLEPAAPGVPAYRLVVPKIAPLPHRTTWRWAQVLRGVRARARPGGRPVARLRRRTPEHTVNIVLVTATRMHRSRLWPGCACPCCRTARRAGCCARRSPATRSSTPTS